MRIQSLPDGSVLIKKAFKGRGPAQFFLDGLLKRYRKVNVLKKPFFGYVGTYLFRVKGRK
jgi:hypothetical protein